VRTALRWIPLAVLFIGIGGGLLGWRRVHDRVRDAFEASDPARRPLQLVTLPVASSPPERWGGSEVDGVVLTEAGVVAVGGSGVFGADGDLGAGLPTLKASASSLWRGRLVVALAQGGIFLSHDGRWQELRSGWGRLHARVLAENAAGELLIGAREGLFRAAWADVTLERLDTRPVRSLLEADGSLLAGGEEGLVRIEGRTASAIATPDPWIETVARTGRDIWVVTAMGLAHGQDPGDLTGVRGGEEVTCGVVHEGRFAAVTANGESLLLFDGGGRASEDTLPSPARRVFNVAGELYADTSRGLLRRAPTGWSDALAKPRGLPPGPAHVTSLAHLGERIVAGLFDGGLLVGAVQGDGIAWRTVDDAAAWGVNALLPAGGEVWVASLRGAARFDGQRLRELEGPGAAFSLASTAEGVAIGYGEGVLLPDGRLLSSFHGLPGNQATALLSTASLVVGTPSGLGAIEARRVAWRATSAEGHLPHPWVTALVARKGSIYIGTYGGGVVRRSDDARFEPFVETEGFKVSAGAMIEVGGTLWLGTEGHGLLRLTEDGSRFEPVPVWLPSPRVTAILPQVGGLLVGTDEGLVRIAVESR